MLYSITVSKNSELNSKKRNNRNKLCNYFKDLHNTKQI